ncbi:MAG: radical SAM protein [bacterium]
MRVVFLHVGAESLGIGYLASILRENGHKAELLFDPSPFGGRLTVESPLLARLTDISRKIVGRLSNNPPDVIGFATFTDTFRWVNSIAGKIRPGFTGKIILGGVHASLCPGESLSRNYTDAILVGEGEISLPLYLKALESGEPADVPGVYTSDETYNDFPGSPIVENLDEIPFPAKELFYEKVPVLEEHYMIISGRGCPFRCTYCCSEAMREVCGGAKYVRRRSVENVIEELRTWKRRGRMKLVVFRDDVFTTSTKWLEKFNNAYKSEIGLPFFCYTYPGTLNEVRADLLRDSGCVFVTMGVQSADETTREKVLKRHHTNESIIETARILKERGIRLSVDHIIGVPGETLKHLHDAASFYNNLRPDRTLIFWLNYYPGTALFEEARDTGALSEAQVKGVLDGEIPFRNLGGMVTECRRPRLQFMLLLSTLPMIPRRLADFVIRMHLYRLIPPAFPLYNLSLLVNALRIKDTMFFHTVKYALSRKRVP